LETSRSNLLTKKR